MWVFFVFISLFFGVSFISLFYLLCSADGLVTCGQPIDKRIARQRPTYLEGSRLLDLFLSILSSALLYLSCLVFNRRRGSLPFNSVTVLTLPLLTYFLSPVSLLAFYLISRISFTSIVLIVRVTTQIVHFFFSIDGLFFFFHFSRATTVPLPFLCCCQC